LRLLSRQLKLYIRWLRLYSRRLRLYSRRLKASGTVLVCRARDGGHRARPCIEEGTQ
jgi:hypothetical protein